MEIYIDSKELSRRLTVKEGTIYSWVSRGLIPSKKINGLRRFRVDIIEEWLAKKEKERRYKNFEE